MKKIIASLSVVLALGAIVVAGTGAFFSDTETSSGNVLTAGAIDLKVDHLKQVYNDVECKTCSVLVKSDTTNMVVARNGSTVTPYAAQALSFVHPAWTANIPDATWIWEQNPVKQEDTTSDVTYTFEKTFSYYGPVTGATFQMDAATDNSYEIKLNGNVVGTDANEVNFTAGTQDTYTGAPISSLIVQGTNTLQVTVKNHAMQGGNPQSNPAGLLYKLVINGNCDSDYFKAECRLWGEKDLVQGDTFWKFNDIKPGDRGVNVLSLHVFNNDAKACLYSGNITDQDNSCTEPEGSSGDTTCDSNTPTVDGELDDVLHFFAWQDNNNGVYEGGETVLVPVNSTLAQLKNADPMNLAATTTAYVGIAWCAGTQGLSGNMVTCDGTTVGNQSQTDSLMADFTAYAVQARNNTNFTCSSVNGTVI